MHNHCKRRSTTCTYYFPRSNSFDWIRTTIRSNHCCNIPRSAYMGSAQDIHSFVRDSKNPLLAHAAHSMMRHTGYERIHKEDHPEHEHVRACSSIPSSADVPSPDIIRAYSKVPSPTSVSSVATRLPADAQP